jgi:hypothetical protein
MMSVHWMQTLRLRDLILARGVRPLKPQVGGGQILPLIGAGPVVLLHTQKVGIKYKKPTLICDDTPGGG